MREIEKPVIRGDRDHPIIEWSIPERHPAVYPDFYYPYYESQCKGCSNVPPQWINRAKRESEQKAREYTLKLDKKMKERAVANDAKAIAWTAELEEQRRRYVPGVVGHPSLSPVVLTWIVTLEKVRQGWPISTPAEVRVTCDGISLAPAKMDTVTMGIT